VSYFALPEIASLSAKTAAGYVSFYWGGTMIGRFVGAVLLRRFKPPSLLALCAIAAAALVTTLVTLGGYTAMLSILAVGLFNSIMFPTIFTLGVAELGPLTGSGSGILNMAIVGGAVLPLIQGVIADRIALHRAFFVPVICYLYMLFYGLSGSKPDSVRAHHVKSLLSPCAIRAMGVGTKTRKPLCTSQNRDETGRSFEATHSSSEARLGS
jgi:MFS transporter, FHS family, L-fucose permease